MTTYDDLHALDAAHVMQTYGRLPVAFVRGEGTRLWDSEGREYLDFLTGLATVSLGHAHPRVADAVAEQARTLLHVSNLYLNEVQPRLAERLDLLLTSATGTPGRVFFANSGAEANECAIKLARRHRRGGDIVSLTDGFHGRTYGSLSATPQETKQEPFAPLVPGFRVVRREDAAGVDAAVDERTAAVLIEPVQGESGIHPVPVEVLRAAREACDRHGALLIFDEVQCGMGRTGSLWAYEQLGVKPDVMTLAKGLGGGLPIGACVTSPDYADVLRPGDHGSTFAGGPVQCSAALAVLDVVDDDDFLAEVRAKGEALHGGLEKLPVQNVRSRGLMAAFDADAAADLVKRALLEERLVLNATGPGTVRLEPPLTVTRQEIAEAVERVARVL